MYYGYYNFPKAAPRPKPKPGKAKKKFGETWWGKKWVEILAGYEDDQRMSRGRAYARADRVKDFKISKGGISATVKGSRDYKVNISFKKHSQKDWEKIVQKIAETPIVLSKLLNNELPEDINKITRYSFIPQSFDAECSCPDYANPCKHIAATFYTLADEIDYEPMILFKLKGMDKNELFKRLELIDNLSISDKKKNKSGANKREVKKVAAKKKKEKTRSMITNKKLKKCDGKRRK